MKTLYRYSIGFGLSVALTLAAFYLASEYGRTGVPMREVAIPLLFVLAVAQLLVQVFYFLHVGDEERPRWRGVGLIFALLVVVIVVGGTLVIMRNVSHGQLHRELFIGGDISPQSQKD